MTHPFQALLNLVSTTTHYHLKFSYIHSCLIIYWNIIIVFYHIHFGKPSRMKFHATVEMIVIAFLDVCSVLSDEEPVLSWLITL